MELRKAARDPWVWGQTILLLVMLLAAPLLPRYVDLGAADFMLNRIDPSSTRWFAAPLMLAGLALLLWGVRSLGPNLTPGVEPPAGAELVTSGAYAHTRHPIYAGAVLLLAGYTLAWSNWTLALVLGGLALGYFSAKARAEEIHLAARFPGYGRYALQVRRRLL